MYALVRTTALLFSVWVALGLIGPVNIFYEKPDWAGLGRRLTGDVPSAGAQKFSARDNSVYNSVFLFNPKNRSKKIILE